MYVILIDLFFFPIYAPWKMVKKGFRIDIIVVISTNIFTFVNDFIIFY